jgi:hypothetical protein
VWNEPGIKKSRQTPTSIIGTDTTVGTSPLLDLFFLGALAFTKKVAPMAAMARKTTAVRNEKIMIIYSYKNIFL